MPELITQLGLDRLSVDQRLQLVGELWDSLASDPEASELTPAQQADLFQRLATHQNHPQSGSPWQDVEQRLRELTK